MTVRGTITRYTGPPKSGGPAKRVPQTWIAPVAIKRLPIPPTPALIETLLSDDDPREHQRWLARHLPSSVGKCGCGAPLRDAIPAIRIGLDG